MFGAFLLFNMKANVAIIFLIIAALSVNHLSGQDADSARVITRFRIDEVSKKAYEISMDTSRMELFRYNPIKKQSFTNTFLGNSGMANQSNFFWQRNPNGAFLFARPYEVYLHHPYNTPHFNTRKPYTELKYLTSGGRDDSEQFLSALHTQNINQYANVGLFYDLIASKGVYQRQNLGSNHFNLFGSYRKKNYQMFASINTNKIQAQENGGLSSINDFKEQAFDAVNYDVRLDNASSVLKYYSFFVTQKLDILRINDTDTSNVVRKTPFSLQHTITYNRYVKNYNDQINPADTSGVYRNNYFLINEASDSAFHHKLSNRFSLNLDFAKETQRLQIFLKHEYKSYAFKDPATLTYLVNDQNKDTVIYKDHQDIYHDVSLGGQYFGILGNWEYNANGSFFMTGYRQNDIEANINFIRYLNDKNNKVASADIFPHKNPIIL